MLNVPIGSNRGSLIWLSQSENDSVYGDYGFFYNTLVLDNIPALAEMHVAAFGVFHVFINGEHVYYDNSARHQDIITSHTLDIGSYLQINENHIVIIVNRSEFYNYKNYLNYDNRGVWSEILINNRMVCKTSEEWLCRNINCYSADGVRRSIKHGFIEALDFNKFPQEAFTNNTKKLSDWKHPDVNIPYRDIAHKFSKIVISGSVSKATEINKLVLSGTAKCKRLTVSVEFSEKTRPFGVYCASTYIYHSGEDMDVSGILFADNPYKMFFNEKLIKEQHVEEIIPGQICINNHPFDRTKLVNFEAPDFSVEIKNGWNHMFMVIEMGLEEYGFSMNLDLNEEDYMLRRAPSSSSLPGWVISGPMNMPLAQVYGNIYTNSLDKNGYLSPISIDATAYALSLDWDNSNHLSFDNEDLVLNEGEYAILDLGQEYLSSPAFTAMAEHGDIVDITTGNKIYNGSMKCYSTARRKRYVQTVTLAGNTNGDEWIAFAPVSSRYIQIFVRHASKPIRFKKLRFYRQVKDYVHQAKFETNDEVFNAIWSNSINTLECSSGYNLMNTPLLENSKFLSFSMLQAISLLDIYQDRRSSINGLDLFVVNQYETGEIPAHHPTNVHFSFIDMHLMFIEWLEMYYTKTADAEVLHDYILVAEKAISYMDNFKAKNSNILYMHPKRGGWGYFIDYIDVKIDGVSTIVNALYCRALLSLSKILKVLGQEEKSKHLYNEFRDNIVNMRSLNWNSEVGLFADNWHGEKGLDSTYSFHANIMAIFGGVASEAQTKSIIDHFFDEETFEWKNIRDEFHSPYFFYFVVKALSSAGRNGLLCSVIKKYWGGIVKTGATLWPERFRVGDHPEVSGKEVMNYGAIVASLLIENLVGIKILEPGFEKILFQPELLEVDAIDFSIPTHLGKITVQWNKTDDGVYQVRLASDFMIKIIPVFPSSMTSDVEFDISDNVQIVAE